MNYFHAMRCHVACQYNQESQFLAVSATWAVMILQLLMDWRNKCINLYHIFFICLAGSSDNSSAWPSHAEGELSAFSLSLAGLHEQHVPLSWLPAYLSWQCLRLPRSDRTQAPLQHLLHDLALCPPHQFHRWQQLTVLHTEKLPGCTAAHGLQQLAVRQRQPQHLPLSGHRGVVIRTNGLASDDGGRHHPSADQAA